MSEVKLSKVNVPYPMPPAMSEEQREKHMAWAVKQGYPRLHGRMMTDDSLQLIGYGASLIDSWQEINPDEPLITMSGSLKFLLEQGLKPRYGKWFHCDVDPRPHKAHLVARHPDVIYLIGSCCNPLTFKALDGMKVALFHAMSGPHTKTWIEENDPNQIMTAGGSTVGLTSVHVGGVMGYYHFEIFGMDGGFRNDKRHAGNHGGVVHGQRDSLFHPGWKTSRLMDNANFETASMLKAFPIFCVYHGDGLMQDWVGKQMLHNAARHGTLHAEIVRKSIYRPITKERVKELQRLGVGLIQNRKAA